VGQKFDICFAVESRRPTERRTLLDTLSVAASNVMAPPRWIARVQGVDVTDGPWNGEPIEVPPNSVVCLYPTARSSHDGAWLIERVGDDEVWTLSLPAGLLASNSQDAMEVLWQFGSIAVPCFAGNEYSMAEVLRVGADALLEAANASSLATHAVVPRGDFVRVIHRWTVLRDGDDRVLLRRGVAHLMDFVLTNDE
jgi:hypothetical protein